MGRGQNRGGGRGGGGRGRGGGRNNRDDAGAPAKRQRTENGAGWIEEGDFSNAAFEEYYKAQDIVPEEQWDEFMACLRSPLPVTFRINGGGRFADHLRDKLTKDFFSHFKEGETMSEGETFQPPRPLPWYPNNYGWHMSFTRQQLRKTPMLEEIHEFMKTANDHGSISRQEAVSMVPPLFLDVQPHHAVLDMCAAPGSKTQQLLEALHSGDTFPTGFVVANDSDFKRCNLLTHQTKRVCSPCLLVTNHSAEQFPEVKVTLPSGKEGPLRFDRILADVPCSGDGTMRKAPDIWRRWTCGGGNGLHLIQLRIALQGCKLLKVGGRMVYSTCTFNPIEDEAVVSELLEACKGSMELVDVSTECPQLKRLPGKTSWKVRDKFRWYESWQDAQDQAVKLDPSMFPTPSKAKLPMERCMRFLPHHQDTGGFFVCVLRKVAEMPTNVHMPTVKDRMGSRSVAAGDAADEEAAGAEEEMKLAEGEGEDAMAADEAAAGEEEAKEDVEMAVGGAEAEAEAAVKVEAAATEAEAAADKEDAVGDVDMKGAEAVAAAAAPGVEAAGKEEGADAIKAAAAAGADAAGPSGADAAADEPRKERVPPLEIARSAAEQAIAAAGAAIDALEKGDANSAEAAVRDATRANMRGGFALDMHGKESRATDKKERKKEDRATSGKEGAGGPKHAADDAGEAGASTSKGKEAPAPKGTAMNPTWVRGGGGRNRAGGGRHSAIDPIIPIEEKDLLQPLLEYYGFKPEFPLWTQLIARSLETMRPKRLYFVCTPIHDVMIKDAREQLKITSTGLKVLERQEIKDSDDNCQYRLAQEGLPFMLPFITRQRVTLKKEDFLALLKERSLMLPDAQVLEAAKLEAAKEEGAAPGRKRTIITDESLISQMAGMKHGCVVAELCPEDAKALGFAAAGDNVSLTANAPMALSAWKGKASLAIMVDKNECSWMLDKISAAMGKGKQ